MNQRKSGFTLLEIMIVVAVIAVLALALLPNLLGSRQAVQDSAIDTTLQRAMTAQEVFQARCGVYFDDGSAAGRCGNAAAGSSEWSRIYQDNDPNVTVTYQAASTNAYCIQASHSSDPSRFWHVDGSTTTQARPAIGTCS